MEISVVIPIYNSEKYLSKCLDSVCAQSECVREIVLVNDGSTDGSLEICNEYAQRDERIKVIDKPNGGTAAAVIDGVNSTTCDYVGFVDADDFIEPNMFRELAGGIERYNADIAFCDYDVVDEKANTSNRRDFGIESGGLFVKEAGKFPIGILPTFAESRYLSASRWNKLFKRELLVNNIAFQDTGIRIGEDLALVMPVIMSATSVVYVKKCLYHYVQREGSAIHVYKKQNLHDWAAANEILNNAASTYRYEIDSFGETALLLLLQNCLRCIHRSDMTKKQKKVEYVYIGSDSKVRRLLKDTPIKAKLKKKFIFTMLKCKLYGLLALVY